MGAQSHGSASKASVANADRQTAEGIISLAVFILRFAGKEVDFENIFQTTLALV